MSVPTASPPPAELNLSLAHGCLGLAVVSMVVSLLLSLADQYTPVVISRGVFSILAALMVVGMLGWLVQVAAGQLRRGQVAVAAEIDALRREAEALRMELADRAPATPRARADHGARSGGRPRGPRSQYWKVYTDVLEDLGGIDGDTPSDN